MTKKNYPESTRDHYILRFADEEYTIEWKTGNLARFMRNLFNCNEQLQKAWPKLTAKKFALRMVIRIFGVMRIRRNRGLGDVANFYLVPVNHPYRNVYCGTAYRKQPNSVKCLQ